MAPWQRRTLLALGALTLTAAALSQTSFAIEDAVDIDAPPAEVWAVLVDGAHYAQWSSQLAWLGDAAAPGATLHLRLSAEGTAPYEFRPVVKTFEPPHRFGWLARTGLPGVFDGEHTFTLEPLGATGTHVINRESYRGVLSLVMQRLPMMANAPAGFRTMNDELKRRVEALRPR